MMKDKVAPLRSALMEEWATVQDWSRLTLYTTSSPRSLSLM